MCREFVPDVSPPQRFGCLESLLDRTIVIGSQPNQNLLCTFINKGHQLQLVGFLRGVVLVNAYSINPQGHCFGIGTNASQGFPQVEGDLDGLLIACERV